MQKNKKSIDILFAATSDYLPYAVVTARSAVEMAAGRPVNIHFMYADIVHPIDDVVRASFFEMAQRSFDDVNAQINFYDISNLVPLLDGQNTGMWGPEVSKTHYFYLLAPMVLPESVERVIYLDTDMIVNCDLSRIYDRNLQRPMLFATPSGDEVEPEMFNSGFSMINLKMWRRDDILTDLLSFGRNLPSYRLCDQNLLNRYFDKKDLEFVSKKYNVFPQLHVDIPIKNIGILHYVGDRKPWNEPRLFRADVWWSCARRTAFWAILMDDLIMTRTKEQIAKASKPRHHSFWWHLVRMKF